MNKDIPSVWPEKQNHLSGRTECILLRSGCKVNLYLEIGAKREDGYHNLHSLFYPLSRPFDRLFILPGTSGCTLACSDAELANENNILLKTYRQFSRASTFRPNLSLYLDKEVPVGAGLGGGSANAAVFLRWLNLQARDKALPEAELMDVALSLGADVPFFLLNRPSWVEGIGEQLFPADISLDGVALIVHPRIEVSTAWAYTELDKMREKKGLGLTSPVRRNYKGKFINGIWLYNDFEFLVFREFPELGTIKETLLGLGADGCVLSGTGASIFSLFSSSSLLHEAVSHICQSGYLYSIVHLNTGVSPSW